VSLRGSDVPGFSDGRLEGRFGRLFRPIIARTLRAADVVAPNSTVLRDLAESFRPDLAGRMRIVENGVEAELIAGGPASSPGNGVRIVQLGQLIARKRPAMTVHAIASLRRNGVDARAVLIGEGPLKSEVEALCHSLEVSEHVELCGRLGRREIPRVLASCDIFVLPSAAEGMSNALLEGMAAGLPIVVTRNGSDEQVSRADSGLVVEIDDQSGFEQALHRLAESQSLRQQLAERGLAHARAMTWERCARAFAELFDELRS
ncbi:MAG: glycosyltransferase family 4 protein, partial [Deltaproteobacteria bacterium]|nr:glycosyltransferase family 4 protein [Deltaproteobacteria bacterium]